MNNTAFQVGNTYEARSLCDFECKWSFTVVARTARFLTLKSDSFRNGSDHSDTARVGICTWSGHEIARPFGSYSMAPTISSEREAA